MAANRVSFVGRLHGWVRRSDHGGGDLPVYWAAQFPARRRSRKYSRSVQSIPREQRRTPLGLSLVCRCVVWGSHPHGVAHFYLRKLIISKVARLSERPSRMFLHTQTTKSVGRDRSSDWITRHTMNMERHPIRTLTTSCQTSTGATTVMPGTRLPCFVTS